jgi:DNA-directed RNA polymerase specialized sigma subunit
MADIKDDLREYCELIRFIDQRLRELKAMNERQLNVTSLLHPTSYIGSSNKNDARIDYIEALDEMGDDIKYDIIEARKRKKGLETLINRLPELRLRNIIRYKYFDGLSWPDVADNMGISLQHTFKLHGTALQALRVFVQKKE